MQFAAYLLVAIGAYLLGSIPTGFLVARARGVDIRTAGSGNIGATNVFRVLGKGPGIFVFAVDMLKGFIACEVVAGLGCWIAGHGFRWLAAMDTPRAAEYFPILAGFVAVLGHNFTCWLNFKGGKGIATSAGVLLALFPKALLVVFGIWILIFAVSRYVSLASIAAAFWLPIFVWIFKYSDQRLGVSLVMSALAIYKHKSNIQRLIAGTEHRMGDKETRAAGTTTFTRKMKITVLGAGAWGTALARMLAMRNHNVLLWDFFPETIEGICKTGRNERYLPGIDLPAGLHAEADANQAVADAELVVVASVSKGFRSVTKVLGSFNGIVASVTKGIEFETGATMTDILRENAPNTRIVAMSGPTLAMEVAKGIPTAIVAASEDAAAAQTVQTLFHSPAFRVYTSSDVHGVELGGALKNVIAIGAGVCDGLGFGDNSKAALLTRSVSEMRRLGVACGAQAETFTGLSGLGDLMVTCFSKLSRNRGFGERLGRGEKAEAIVASMVAVAEGYPTARSARELARKRNIVTPVIDEVYAMLYEGKDVRKAVQDLTTRESKAED